MQWQSCWTRVDPFWQYCSAARQISMFCGCLCCLFSGVTSAPRRIFNKRAVGGTRGRPVARCLSRGYIRAGALSRAKAQRFSGRFAKSGIENVSPKWKDVEGAMVRVEAWGRSPAERCLTRGLENEAWEKVELSCALGCSPFS